MSQNTTIRAAAIHAANDETPKAELPKRTQTLLKPRTKKLDPATFGDSKREQAQGLALEASIVAKTEADLAQLLNAVPQPTAPKAKRVIEDNTNGVQPMPKLPRSVRKPKPAQICQCGCGGTTKGGRFVPGHDARLHGWALRVSRGLVKLEDIKHEGERAAVKAHLAAGGK